MKVHFYNLSSSIEAFTCRVYKALFLSNNQLYKHLKSCLSKASIDNKNLIKKPTAEEVIDFIAIINKLIYFKAQ